MKYLDGYEKMFEKRETVKVNFEWNDMKFKNIGLLSWAGGGYYAPIGAVSQVVRQYIKQKIKVPFQIASSSYAGGDSIRVYISPLDVNEDKFKEIKSDLETTFSDGQFDGMEDIYNYGDNEFVVEIDGHQVEFGTKYFFCEHRPKYDTKKYKDWEKTREDR